jgi:hypothetical protein
MTTVYTFIFSQNASSLLLVINSIENNGEVGSREFNIAVDGGDRAT